MKDMVFRYDHCDEGGHNHEPCDETEHYECRAYHLYDNHDNKGSGGIHTKRSWKSIADIMEMAYLADTELQEHNPYEQSQEKPSEIGIGVTCRPEIQFFKQLNRCHSHNNSTVLCFQEPASQPHQP